MEIKATFAVFAAVIGTASYAPYLRDMLRGTTKPHVYTWLIWTLTTGTAAAGAWYGGGGYSAASQTLASCLTFLFFFLSLRYGTKNITRSDTLILFAALFAIGLWWLLRNPLLSVLLVTVIDVIAYAPSYRKSFSEPWSESVLAWNMFTLAMIFSILSIAHYNVLTVIYLAMTVAMNIGLVALCLYRRQCVPKPS
jgi:hypothetical protein